MRKKPAKHRSTKPAWVIVAVTDGQPPTACEADWHDRGWSHLGQFALEWLTSLFQFAWSLVVLLARLLWFFLAPAQEQALLREAPPPRKLAPSPCAKEPTERRPSSLE